MTAVPPVPSSEQPLPRASGVGRRSVLLAAKAAVTIALLVFLGAKLDWAVIGARVQSVSLGLLVVVLAIVTAAVPLAALRWMLLARRAGADMSFMVALQLNFAGLFFGQVLPASIGGDAVRGLLAYRNGLPWPPLVSSLVLDRIIALAAAVVLILCALPLMMNLDDNALTWTASISAVVVVALIGGLFIDLLPWPQSLKTKRLIAVVLDLIARTRATLASRAGVWALGLSIVIHVMTIAAVAIIGTSLGLGNILMASALVVPTALIAAAVPISLNGWGVREGMIVAGFALFGIPEADAFLISVLLGFSVVLSALPGGLTWLMLR